MKKLTKTLLAVFTVATMAASIFSLAACNEGKAVDCSNGHHYENGVCTECKGVEPQAPIVVDCSNGHVDEKNNSTDAEGADGKCDNCGGEIVKKVDCSKGHVDEKNNTTDAEGSDGKCDNCGGEIVAKVDCSNGHVDADSDGVCDSCKAITAGAVLNATGKMADMAGGEMDATVRLVLNLTTNKAKFYQFASVYGMTFTVIAPSAEDLGGGMSMGEDSLMKIGLGEISEASSGYTVTFGNDAIVFNVAVNNGIYTTSYNGLKTEVTLTSSAVPATSPAE